MNRFEAFPDMNDRWRWRLLAEGGHVIASSGESFASHEQALRAAEGVRTKAANADLCTDPAIGPKEVIAGLIEREEARRLKVALEGNRNPAARRVRGATRARVVAAPRRIRALGSRRLS